MLPLWKSVWRIFKKLKIDLLYDPAIPHLGLFWKDFTSYSTESCSTKFIAVPFTITRI